MIEKPEAKKQVMRFSGLAFFPLTTEAMNELVMAMCAFETVKAAKAFADDWLERNTETPKPVHVRRCAHGPQIAQFTKIAPTECAKCGDSGYRMERRGEYDFAVKCECRLVTQ